MAVDLDVPRIACYRPFGFIPNWVSTTILVLLALRDKPSTTPALGPHSNGGHAMFRVENADYIADKLSAELLPNQEFREVLKNSLEAVERRMDADGWVEDRRQDRVRRGLEHTHPH
jgi:hypothetical protein